jgi:iron complex outermembrane receptor protein
MNYGFFGEYSFNKIDNLLINVGAYANYNSDFGWQILPGIDIGCTFYKGLRAFANAGTGQRLPTYTDLYYKGPSNIGNAQLTPEHSVYSEVGLKYNSDRMNASLSYFSRNTSDFIDWVKEEITDPWQPQNFQEINTKGISFSGDYRMLNSGNSSDFSLLAGITYTWLQPKIKQKQSTNKISQYALDNLRNQLAVRADVGYLNRYHLTIGTKYHHRFNYDEYILLDTRLAVKLKRLEFYADVNNLTNISYVEAGAVPMVGRWTTVGMKWVLGGR